MACERSHVRGSTYTQRSDFWGGFQLQAREEASTLLCTTEIAPQPAAKCWGAIEKSL